MDTRTNDMMASKTSPPSFTCQHTCLFKPQHRPLAPNPPITRPDAPSRRRKKGPRGSLGCSGPFRIASSSASAGPRSPVSPPVDPSRTPSGAGPVLRQDPSAPQFLLDSWAGQATLVPRPNLVSHSVGGGASAVGAVGFGSCCWGAASADDVVVAPFLLIPSSFEVEEPHSQCQAHRYLRQAETLQTSVHIIVYSLLIRS